MDSKHRGQGVGTKLAVALAKHLVAKGYTGIGNIQIQTQAGKYHQASSKMKDLFTSTFKQELARNSIEH